MDAIGAQSSRQPDVVFDQHRAAGVHRGAKDRRGDGFRIGQCVGRETDERTGDRRGLERFGENLGEGVGVSRRKKRSDEIERARGRGLRGQAHQQQIRSETVMSPTIAAK